MSDPRFLQEGYEAQSAHVVEEIGEAMAVLGDLAAAIGKAGRWGLDGVNPLLEPEDQETNRAWIFRALDAAKPELQDVMGAIERLQATMGVAALSSGPLTSISGSLDRELARKLALAVVPFVSAAAGTSDFWADERRMTSLRFDGLRVEHLRNLAKAVAVVIKADEVSRG